MVSVAVLALLFLGWLLVARLVLAPWQERTQRERTQEKLGRIGEALLAYERAHASFPGPAVCGPDGSPRLSWRVAILPYFGPEEAKLYQEFHLEEPWDGPHNQGLLERMPAVYAHPRRSGRESRFVTHYQVFVGLKQHRAHPVFCLDRPPVSLRAVENEDGANATLLVVEAAQGVPWTKPEDIAYTPDRPVTGLGGLFEDGAYAVMASGRVTLLPVGIDPELLHMCVTYDDRLVFISGPADR